MFKKLVTILMAAAIGIGSVLVGGCESGAQTGSVVGGLAGAGGIVDVYGVNAANGRL